ncbi:hypothetical protein JOD29_000557 [Lysinibacillus composti]|uniref:Uncharacterized protein n=1 Tax=Lysinibacillus composti TaxID=720633 RepID=A0A3N9UJA9_9BACI|nr:hypothetical protein [Lysinibacillus composti]MBM7607320.1 hypothetical protein [Lysinibacillus composti]RQW76109.1 hypothetical protein EBB45_00720 [Lysinibacillus composti]
MLKLILYILIAVISFLLFVTGMLFAEQVPVLTLVGIIGLACFSYTVFNCVLNLLISQDH